MGMFLWIGSALGAVLGLVHGIYVYRDIAARADGTGAGAGNRSRALYHGVWTFALWTLFGSYVLAFWLIGTAARALAGLKRTHG